MYVLLHINNSQPKCGVIALYIDDVRTSFSSTVHQLWILSTYLEQVQEEFKYMNRDDISCHWCDGLVVVFRIHGNVRVHFFMLMIISGGFLFSDR